MRTIDANVILRFLTNDLPDQANQAASLLKKVENKQEQVFLPDIILADIIWILEGYYKQSREQVRDWIIAILSLPGLEFPSKKVAFNALDIYVENRIDWSDAFTAGQMIAQGITEIISFDKHFDSIKGIIRIEPKCV